MVNLKYSALVVLNFLSSSYIKPSAATIPQLQRQYFNNATIEPRLYLQGLHPRFVAFNFRDQPAVCRPPTAIHIEFTISASSSRN
jgi:hypothetical protein